MRYPASEKLEIIRIVEQSHLPVRRTLTHLGVPPATFYLYGLLPLRKRPSGWGVLASLRTCIRRLGSDPSARMANPHARASTDGRPTSGRDSSQALRASV
jgi:hypothetical protein